MKQIILLLIGSGLFLCAKSQERNDPKWKEHSARDYSIKYPATWELNLSGQMGTSFLIFSPLESANDQFRENVNLLVQDLSASDIDLNKYVEISLGQVKDLLKDGKVTESKRVKKGAGEYHYLAYEGTMRNFQLSFRQYFWIVGSSAYVLTFTAEQSRMGTFEGTGMSIMDSFNLKLFPSAFLPHPPQISLN